MAMESALVRRDRIGVQDFVLLENYRSEEAFMDNLRKRFKENLIYTYIGSVVVSVNPYKTLDIYDANTMEQYRGINFYELPPHLFAISDTAYRAMRNEGRDQCVLISGESGAGKTEASKKILHYLAQCSGHKGEVDRVKDRLLQSNPVLEAFGNAKTNRNDNSSRFGKYMDIQFDYKGSPVGGHIKKYLLEKSRVINQAPGERNFHIFYQLLQADKTLLTMLELSANPSDYHYICQADSVTVSTINDRKDFLSVQSGLVVLGFSNAEVKSLWSIVGAILHLGNVSFEETEQGLAQLTTAGRTSVNFLSTLTQCPRDLLQSALTHRLIEARKEKLLSPLTVEQACYARDALAKAVYERLFTWLVNRLNSSLESQGQFRKTVMGLLDIYGFEIFESNSFEQFCINYCNEKLQQLFIELTLKSEQEEYLSEGIEWEPVEYFNNKIICDLVEEKHKGIIAVLDEECLRPGEVTDMTFLAKLTSTVGTHAHFVTHETSDYEARKTIERDQFRLCHYAGDVTYKVDGFVDKNNDLLYRSSKEAISASKDDVLVNMFPPSELASQKRPPTAGTQFKTSLSELMTILVSKEPSYVRCIKPNSSKRPAFFDEGVVRHQVKYLGLMENLRVRRAGFCYRRVFDVFLERYKSICPVTWPFYNGSPMKGTRALFSHLRCPSDDYRIGKTKVFIRFPKTLFDIEDRLQKRRHELVTMLIANWRMCIAKRKYQNLKAASIVFQKHWRRIQVQRYARRYRESSTIVRRFIKGFIYRNKPKCPENFFFLEFVKVTFLRNLLSLLPISVLHIDSKWPAAPPALMETSGLLKTIYRSYVASKLMRGLSQEQKTQLTMKAAASDLFKGRKESYPASVPCYFCTSHLTQHDMQTKQQSFDTKHPDAGSHRCVKFDRHGYKKRQRVFLITDKNCYLLETGSFKLKEQFPLSAMSGISISSRTDGIIVIHLPTEGSGARGDLILESDHLIELVLKLSLFTGKMEKVDIKKDNTLFHNLPNGTVGTITVQQGSPPSAIKGKTGNLEIVTPPAQ